MAHLAPATRARRLSAVKSLFAFDYRLGYLAFDVGAAVTPPAVRNALAERILTEVEVHRMLALAPAGRDRILLTLLYAAGLRISELCALAWRDLRPCADGARGSGQITVFGKGGKTRTILLPATIWRVLTGLRGGADVDASVFVSRKGGRLDPSAVHRVVKAAVKRAGLDPAASGYWLRHAHASHALDRGASIHLFQATLSHGSVATTGRYLHAQPNDSSARYLAV